MKAICLNLDTRPDRWEQSKKEFIKQGLQVERFAAVEMKDPVLSFNASQIKILSSTTENTIVFEDDVRFINNKLNDVLKTVPDDWEILYFGGNVLQPLQHVKCHWWRCLNTWTTHAVAYTPKGAKKILGLWKNRGVVYDEFLRLNQSKLKAYICKPFVCDQRPDFSDLMKTKVDYSKFFIESEKKLV
jgi:GR25 family glycosyltransferase involved in LPS biosynthesis